ncbi:MAG: lipoprotein-releasing ABC transporter permease subunit [Gammaproteobacteria bacterium]|nr:lipoprotein-releasing ABC transporter permease subunit [Gammaproteobacteria bacterium]
MFHPLSLALGLRYLRAKRDSGFVSFISAISIIGITLGIMALIVVLSVMNGFQTEVRDRMLGNAAHGTLFAADGGLDNWPEVVNLALGNPEVLGAAPFVESQVMFMSAGAVQGGLLRGIDVDLEPSVTNISEQIVEGDINQLKEARFQVVIGRALADALGLAIGDKLTVVAPEANVNVLGVTPRNKRFTIAAIFESGMYSFDMGVVLTAQKDAAILVHLGENVTGVRLKLADVMRAYPVVQEVIGRSEGTLYGTDWTRQNSNYFKAVQTERTIMFIILTMIVAVAAFNIVSTLVMVVNDKQSDIAIIRTIGGSKSLVLKVFLVQGAVIGILGTLVGVILGTIMALNVTEIVQFVEQASGSHIFDPTVYQISEIPSRLLWTDVGVVALTGFGLTLLATLYPAWSASRTNPAEALRYE